MKIQKKWLVALAVTTSGGFLLNLDFNHVSKDIEKSSSQAIGIIKRKPLDTAKLDKSRQTDLTKVNFDNSRIEYADVSLEIADEMEYFDDTNTGMHLKEHFAQMENIESGAQDRLDESMEEMRERPGLYTEKLAEAYEQIDRDDYPSRYKIVYIMENIRSPDAIQFFSELAVSDLPEGIELYKGDGHINETQQESLLRMRGVGGLYALASEGDEKARNALMDTILNSKIQTVKNDAIWAYLSTSENIDAEKEHLKTVLPEKEHPFLTVELTDIEDVQKLMEHSSEFEQ
jgi:hypothetical protein